MRLVLLAISFAFFFASCTSTSPLYTWSDYEKTSYGYLNNADEKSSEELIKSYQEIIDMQNGTRGEVPPGIYADYGYLLLQQGQTELGREFLQREISLYPESEVFINRILRLSEE